MHPVPFVARPILHLGTPAPAAAPQVAHPSQPPGWNRGVSAYQEAFGPEGWAKYSDNSYPAPMPADSPAERQGLSDLIEHARLAFATKAYKSGRRGTHGTGVVGRGTITIASNLDLPPHELFVPGRTFPCRLRHANASYNDDAAAVVRSASLKFADAQRTSPLDLVMNTGPIGAFWNLESFMDFVQARARTNPERDDWESQRDWCLRRPMGFIGSIESIRLAPSSFAEMCYYTKIVFPYAGLDGRARYIKFRLIPLGIGIESGLPPARRQTSIWAQGRDPDDGQPNDYLRREYAGRVERGAVEYSLEAQVRDADPETDTHELLNMDSLWDEAAHPWRELAHVRIHELLPDAEAEVMQMWLGHSPASLGVLEAYSIYDYRSMGHARALLYPASQVARAIAAQVRGAPPPLGTDPWAY